MSARAISAGTIRNRAGYFVRDREQAIRAIVPLVETLAPGYEAQTAAMARMSAARIVDAYEALPVVVDDETVDRFEASYRESQEWPQTQPKRWTGWRYRVRIALEAALNSGGTGGDRSH